MFWPEIVKAAAYLKHKTLTNNSKYKLPHEIFFGVKAKANIRKFIELFSRIPEELRDTKLDDKGKHVVLFD